MLEAVVEPGVPPSFAAYPGAKSKKCYIYVKPFNMFSDIGKNMFLNHLLQL